MGARKAGKQTNKLFLFTLHSFGLYWSDLPGYGNTTRFAHHVFGDCNYDLMVSMDTSIVYKTIIPQHSNRLLLYSPFSVILPVTATTQNQTYANDGNDLYNFGNNADVIYLWKDCMDDVSWTDVFGFQQTPN